MLTVTLKVNTSKIMTKNIRKRTPITRDKHVACFLTEEDAEWLDGYAKDCGMKGRSALITAILERIIIGGGSARVFSQLGWQLQKRFSKGLFDFSSGFYWGVKPLPKLPESDEDASIHERLPEKLPNVYEEISGYEMENIIKFEIEEMKILKKQRERIEKRRAVRG